MNGKFSSKGCLSLSELFAIFLNFVPLLVIFNVKRRFNQAKNMPPK